MKGHKRMATLRRIFKWGSIGILIFSVSLCSYNFFTAEARVKKFCLQIKPGMTLADLRSFSSSNGLGPGKAHEGLNYLVESKTFGRHGCRVVVKSGHVQESTYTYAD